MILKTYTNFKKLDELDFEIVERKGRCHPDTLSDRLAELLSVTYSKLTYEKFGVVLRHQFDKLSLMGGKCDVKYGGGNFRSPIRLLINGRATQKFGDEYFDFRDLIIKTARDFLEKELVNFNFDVDCRVMWESTSNPTRGMIDNENNGKSAIHHRFAPRGLQDLPEAVNPISNDTAVGCFTAPYSKLEKLIINIEKSLTSDEARNVYPWLGTDCKIMGSRIEQSVNLTVSIPQISTFVNGPQEYLQNLDIIREIINRQIKDSGFLNVDLTLNPGDNTDKEMFYLRYTGSCIESGDEGQVSRGNRLGGIISSKRSFTVEGLSGKNPAYHAGKIYSMMSFDIANEIHEEMGIACEVLIVSQIDRLVSDPWVVILNTDKKADEVKAMEIINRHVSKPGVITSKILSSSYPISY